MNIHLTPVNHWKLQRLSAFLLIPLCIWFVVSIVSLSHGNYASVVHWLNDTSSQVLFSFFILISAIHSILGLEVVIEDYIKNPLRQPVITIMKYTVLIISLLSIYALFNINIEAIYS